MVRGVAGRYGGAVGRCGGDAERCGGDAGARLNAVQSLTVTLETQERFLNEHAQQGRSFTANQDSCESTIRRKSMSFLFVVASSRQTVFTFTTKSDSFQRRIRLTLLCALCFINQQCFSFS